MEKSKIAMMLEKEMEPIKKMCEPLEEAVKHELSKGIENVDAKELGEVVDMIKDLYEAKEKLVKACYYKQIMEAMEEHDFEDEEEIMDEGRRGYRGQPRDSRGRYMSRRGGRRGYEEPMYYQMTPEMYHMYPAEYYRDMDRESGKMYYSGSGSNSGGSSSGSMSGGSSGMSGGQSSGGSSGGGSMGYSESGRGSQGGRRDSREGRSGQSRRSYMESKEQGKDKQEKMKNLEEYMRELGSDVSEMIEGASPEEKTMLKNKMQVLMQKIQ